MRKITKNKLILTVAQVATLACAVGVVKTKSKAGKTMFGLGAVGTTIWSILRGVNIDNEDDTYYRENVKGRYNEDVEDIIEDIKEKRAAVKEKAWIDLEKIFNLVGKRQTGETATEVKTAEELVADIPVVGQTNINYAEPFESGYMRVTAPFVYNSTSIENTEGNKQNNKAVGKLNIEALAEEKRVVTMDDNTADGEKKGDGRSVELHEEFGLLDELDVQPIKWAELDIIGDSDSICAVDKEIFNILKTEYNYDFIREQGPSSESWLYYVPEEKGKPERERFIAVSVDLNKMMDAYRNGLIKGTASVKYDIQHIYKYDKEMRKPIKINSLSEMTADTVYVSESGTVLVLLGRSNTHTIHTAVSKHCKRVSLITLEELSKATCSCLWS